MTSRHGVGEGATDTVRFAIIEALARRGAALQGEASRLVMQRVEQLRAEPLADRGIATTASPAGTNRGTSLAGLVALVDRLGRATDPAGAPTPDAPQASLRAVTAFKRTWSRLRAEQRLRQTLAQVPVNSGPLNSSHVMNRTLQTLHAISPEYLDAFMSHVDTLIWLEQHSGSGARPSRKR